MSVKSKITKSKKGFTYKLVLEGLTQGELLALHHGMQNYANVSPVAVDVSAYIVQAVTESGAFSFEP